MGRPRMTATEAFGRLHQPFRALGTDTDQDPTLAARGDGHVSADEKGQPAEIFFSVRFRSVPTSALIR